MDNNEIAKDILVQVPAMYSRSAFLDMQQYFGTLTFKNDGSVIFSGSSKSFTLKDVPKELTFTNTELTSLVVNFPHNIKLTSGTEVYTFLLGQQSRNKYGLQASEVYVAGVAGGTIGRGIVQTNVAKQNEQITTNVFDILQSHELFKSKFTINELKGIKSSKVIGGLTLSFALFGIIAIIFILVLMALLLHKFKTAP